MQVNSGPGLKLVMLKRFLQWASKYSRCVFTRAVKIAPAKSLYRSILARAGKTFVHLAMLNSIRSV